MDTLLGLGGEGVVVRKMFAKEHGQVKCGIRITPAKISDMTESVLDFKFVDTVNTYKTDQPRELAANSLAHPNIIAYLDHTFEIIDDDIFH